MNDRKYLRQRLLISNCVSESCVGLQRAPGHIDLFLFFDMVMVILLMSVPRRKVQSRVCSTSLAQMS